AFAPEPFNAMAQRSVYQSMRASLRRAFTLLEKNLSDLSDAFREEAKQVLAAEQEILAREKRLLDRRSNASKIRIHGDYHLGHAHRRRPLPRTLGRPLVSPNEQRFPPKLFKNGRRRDLHPAKSRRSPNHASSVFARQSRLRNRLRTEPSPRLGRHPRPRHQTHFEIGVTRCLANSFGKRRGRKSAPKLRPSNHAVRVNYFDSLLSKRPLLWARADSPQ